MVRVAMSIGLNISRAFLRNMSIPRHKRPQPSLTSLSKGSFRWMALLVCVVASLLIFTPYGQDIESRLGLQLLFSTRGPIAAPENVSIVSLDQDSALLLDLPKNYSQWPRTIHADMIQHLTQLGAKWIFFDIAFREARQLDEDQLLAQALRKTKNVGLFKYSKKPDYHLRKVVSKGQSTPFIVTGEQQILPLPLFSTASVATASFVLPDTPLLSNAPLYRMTPRGVDAQIPLVAYQLSHDGRQHFIEILEQIAPLKTITMLKLEANETRFANRLHDLLKHSPELHQKLEQHISTQIDSPIKSTLLNLLDAYHEGSKPKILNFYGPAHTIPTIPYYEFFRPDVAFRSTKHLREHVEGKVVFIGLSEVQQTEQADHYITHLTTEQGVDLPGVEIAATMYANLSQNHFIKPLTLWQQALMALFIGLVLYAMSEKLSFRSWIITTTLMSISLTLLSCYIFSHYQLWLPIITLAIILPAFILLVIFWRSYAFKNQQHRMALATLSRYVPTEIAQQMQRNYEQLGQWRSTVDGVCLLTDIEGYTTFSESCPPDQLHRILNDYYATVAQAVEQHGGRIINIVGDGLLAIWSESSSQALLSRQACQAALDIVKATDRHHGYQHPTGLKLKTCVGIHRGKISLGNLGASSHFEFAPVGDTVNTTSRIEAFNRTLKTRILMSQSIQHLVNSRFDTLDQGEHLLKGKHQKLRLYELVGYL